MKKRIISALAMVLCMAMLFGTTVFAAENTPDYVVTYSAAEVTDVATLAAMGLAQRNRLRSYNAAVEDSCLLSVEQLLEERQYADGTVEQSRVVTTLGLTASQAGDEELVSSNNWPFTPGYSVHSSFYYKIIDCPQKPLIYGHSRRIPA